MSLIKATEKIAEDLNNPAVVQLFKSLTTENRVMDKYGREVAYLLETIAPTSKVTKAFQKGLDARVTARKAEIVLLRSKA